MRNSLNLYLTDAERAWVQDASEMLGVTQSYVIRLILRKYIGLPVGDKGEAEFAHLVTTNMFVS
jgi:hypothetical protein